MHPAMLHAISKMVIRGNHFNGFIFIYTPPLNQKVLMILSAHAMGFHHIRDIFKFGQHFAELEIS